MSKSEISASSIVDSSICGDTFSKWCTIFKYYLCLWSCYDSNISSY